MTVQEAWDELDAMKNSWRKRGLPSTDAFLCFASMLCRFALANNVTLSTLQNQVNEILSILYSDLTLHRVPRGQG